MNEYTVNVKPIRTCANCKHLSRLPMIVRENKGDFLGWLTGREKREWLVFCKRLMLDIADPRTSGCNLFERGRTVDPVKESGFWCVKEDDE